MGATATGGMLRASCYSLPAMVYSLHKRVVAAGLAALVLSGCADSGDRYPDLSLRDFERVQGAFTPIAPPQEAPSPAPLRATTIEELEAALSGANASHQAFLSAAEQARPIVASAAGKGIEDNRWPVAQVEIAALESRNGDMASLLADLDVLYADASFEFVEREKIDLAREQVTGYHRFERQLIAELITLLVTNPTGRSQ